MSYLVMCIDLCTGDSDRHLSWEFEAKYARRIAIPLKKFNIEEKGSGEVWSVLLAGPHPHSTSLCPAPTPIS